MVFARSFLFFLRNDQGASTPLALMWFILFCGLGGIALDGANGFRVQTAMQAASDSACHAGLIELIHEKSSDDVVKSVAKYYAAFNMPEDVYGNLLDASDVDIGTWNPANRVFSEGGSSPNAVRTILRSTGANGNAVPVTLLRIIGLDFLNVNVVSICATTDESCLNDGLIAGGRLDIETGNTFINHICLHGEEGVDLQTGNSFENGVSITSPGFNSWADNDWTTPAYPTVQNEGLDAAAGKGHYDPDIGGISADIAALINSSTTVYPDGFEFMTAPKGIVTITDMNNRIANPVPGTIYHIKCGGDYTKKTDLKNTITYEDVIIVSECMLNNGAGSTFKNVILASYAPPGMTYQGEPYPGVKLSSDVILGDSNWCSDKINDPENTPDASVTIYSTNSIKTSDGTYYYGVRMYATENITLTADNEGIEGIVAHAGGDIHLTTDNSMALCETMPKGSGQEYFAIVQ